MTTAQRCATCGGGRVTASVEVPDLEVWDEDTGATYRTDPVDIGLCPDCITRLAAGADLTAYDAEAPWW